MRMSLGAIAARVALRRSVLFLIYSKGGPPRTSIRLPDLPRWLAGPFTNGRPPRSLGRHAATLVWRQVPPTCGGPSQFARKWR
jgi:hypothetical protein